MNFITDKIVRIIGLLVCCAFFGGSEGVQFPARCSLEPLTREYEQKLTQSEIYIAVTVYNQIPYIPNLRQTLEMNVRELTKRRVGIHLIITCDGMRDDYMECLRQFADFPLPTEEMEIIFNEENKGVSLTRHDQLNRISELSSEDRQNGRYPYFFIFDGDDLIHKDFLLIELLVLFKTGADTVSPGDCFKVSPVNPEVYSEVDKVSPEPHEVFDVDKSIIKELSSGNVVRCEYKDSREILKKNVRKCRWILHNRL